MPLRRLVLCLTGSLFTLVAAPGCSLDSSRSVSHPIVQPPDIPGPVPSFAISGVVFQHTASARQPAAGVSLAVFSEEAVFVTTDANGRYSASARGDIVSIAPSETAGFMAPCPSGTSSLSFTGKTSDWNLNACGDTCAGTDGAGGTVVLVEGAGAVGLFANCPRNTVKLAVPPLPTSLSTYEKSSAFLIW